MSKQTKIEPPDGWSVQTKYGTLRLRDGTDCVRLQDVHSWFLRDGTPASEVNWKMFSPLLDAAREACDGALDAPGELAACKLLVSLRLVCADERPVQIFAGRNLCKWGKGKNECETMRCIKARAFASSGDFEDTWIERYVPFLTFMQSDQVKAFRSNFPGLGHHRFEDDTPAGLVYGMAEGVVRVWRGTAVAATDPVLMGRIKKDRAEDDEYRIKWPSDDVLSLALERVAVPIAIANELWGWGRVVPVEAQATPAKDASPVANELWDWGRLVPVEAQAAPVIEASEAQAAPAKDTAPSVPKKVQVKDMSPEWTGARLLARQIELKTAEVKVKSFAEQTAKEAGIPVREASRRIKAHKEGGATANVADQLKVVGTKNKAA